MSVQNAVRRSGVLMPIFSLPSPYGVGTLGRQARDFAASGFIQDIEANIEYMKVTTSSEKA